MIIKVGSKNPVKVNAVKETISNYSIFSGAEVLPIDISSGVSNQPKSLEETIQGAMNRAKKSFGGCEYSFGIEDGLAKIPQTKTNYMNFCVCAIYDGKQFHLGLSSGFEYPKEVTSLVFKEGLEIDEAFHKAGLTSNPRIGEADGVIGMLTNGRLTRKDYTKQAVVMAMLHLENPTLY